VLAALAHAHRQTLEELDAITIADLVRAVVPAGTAAPEKARVGVGEPAEQPVAHERV
jgi:hypothetical protein